MPNKRGNQGYGKAEMIKANFDKFSPLFWNLMGEMAKSKVKEDKKFFMQEFNKIQTKMLPTELTGKDGEPVQVQWLSPSPTVPESGQTVSTVRVSAG